MRTPLLSLLAITVLFAACAPDRRGGQRRGGSGGDNNEGGEGGEEGEGEGEEGEGEEGEGEEGEGEEGEGEEGEGEEGEGEEGEGEGEEGEGEGGEPCRETNNPNCTEWYGDNECDIQYGCLCDFEDCGGGPGEGEGEGEEGEGEGGEGEGEGVGPVGDLVDPECVDGEYTEALPTRNADIDDILDSYDRDDREGFLLDLLDARYRIGSHIVEGGLDGDCLDVVRPPYDWSSADRVVDQIGTIVHECGHVLDLRSGGFGQDIYVINEDLTFRCSGGDSTDRGGQTFARSRIKDDEYSNDRPPGVNRGDDFYALTYLDGDPDNQVFEGGDQGFSLLFEEVVQYVNSLATAYAFSSERQRGVVGSDRDGILTFLWYLERYLRLARTEYPRAYDFIIEDECWRESILTVWGRAWLYLEVTKNDRSMGIDDDAIQELVETPELLSEIQRVREAHGCPAAE